MRILTPPPGGVNRKTSELAALVLLAGFLFVAPVAAGLVLAALTLLLVTRLPIAPEIHRLPQLGADLVGNGRPFDLFAVRFQLGLEDLGVVVELLAQRLHDSAHHLDAPVPLVVILDNGPRRAERACPEQHLFHRSLILVPLVAVAPVFGGQLPAFVRGDLALLEAAQLLIFADVNPELEHNRSEIHQLPLELVDLPVGALPGNLVAETLDPLHHDTAVPTAVEDRDLAAFRQAPPEAIEIMVGLVLAFGGGDRVNDIAARVQLLGDTFDRTALAGRVPALKDHHHRPLLHVDLVAQFAQGDLVTDQLLNIFLTSQCLS